MEYKIVDEEKSREGRIKSRRYKFITLSLLYIDERFLY